jgi:hypothetical protein
LLFLKRLTQISGLIAKDKCGIICETYH